MVAKSINIKGVNRDEFVMRVPKFYAQIVLVFHEYVNPRLAPSLFFVQECPCQFSDCVRNWAPENNWGMTAQTGELHHMSLPLAHEYYYEMARFLYDRGEFNKALEKFQKASELFLQNKLYDRYIDTTYYILRILAEQEKTAEIQIIKEKLQDLVVQQALTINSRVHYVLGLCSYYRGGQVDLAMDYFQKALKQALEADNKVDMCHAIFGIAQAYYAEDRLEESLKELYNLEVFFGAIDLPELRITSKHLNGLILRNRGDYDKALECFWQAYEMLKSSPKLVFYFGVLHGLGTTYQRMGETQLARLYLQLAMKSLNEKELTRLHRLISDSLAEMGAAEAPGEYDLVFNPDSKSVVEKNLGRVDFKNQFILLDLLHLFLKNPGKTFPKEILAKKVWNQDYDPTIHDNKIYVTIKRLRQLIEPDFNNPKYIFRAKGGYYLNKNAKVLVGH